MHNRMLFLCDEAHAAVYWVSLGEAESLAVGRVAGPLVVIPEEFPTRLKPTEFIEPKTSGPIPAELFATIEFERLKAAPLMYIPPP